MVDHRKEGEGEGVMAAERREGERGPTGGKKGGVIIERTRQGTQARSRASVAERTTSYATSQNFLLKIRRVRNLGEAHSQHRHLGKDWNLQQFRDHPQASSGSMSSWSASLVVHSLI